MTAGGTKRPSHMATKKDQGPSQADVAATQRGTGSHQERIEARRQRRTEATTVDGTESFPPPGMDLPDGGVVPLEGGDVS